MDNDFEAIDLQPVRDRVEWAGRHLVRLRRLVDAYVASNPTNVFLSKTPDGGTIIETVHLSELPPMAISLVLGDIAHHLRAALDNLVGVLRLGGPTRSTAFPIAVSPTDFDRLAHQMLNGVPTWAVQAVRELQPFNPDDVLGPLGHRLDAIDQVAQRDRHRALLLHAPVVDVTPTHYADHTMLGYPVVEHTLVTDRVAAEVRYPTGALIRSLYTVTVVLGEDVPTANNHEVVHLATRWLDDLRTVIQHIDAAADAAWDDIYGS